MRKEPRTENDSAKTRDERRQFRFDGDGEYEERDDVVQRHEDAVEAPDGAIEILHRVCDGKLLAVALHARELNLLAVRVAVQVLVEQGECGVRRLAVWEETRNVVGEQGVGFGLLEGVENTTRELSRRGA